MRTHPDRRAIFRGGRRAEDYPHGTRDRRQLGCTCRPCKAADASYSVHRYAARAKGDWNGWVQSDQAQAYLAGLQRQGIGVRQAAKLAGVSVRTIQRIRSGASQTIRARVARQVLGIVPALAHGALVNGYRTRHLLHALRAEEYTDAQLALRLGLRSGRIQFDYEHVTVRTALKVRSLFDRLTGDAHP